MQIFDLGLSLLVFLHARLTGKKKARATVINILHVIRYGANLRNVIFKQIFSKIWVGYLNFPTSSYLKIATA